MPKNREEGLNQDGERSTPVGSPEASQDKPSEGGREGEENSGSKEETMNL